MSLCCFGFESAPTGSVGPSFITSVSNTNSINLSVVLGNLTSNLIVDPNPLNVISVSPTGTLVQLSGKNISLFTNDVGYITGNQNITVTGEATGSGTTNIALTLDNTAVISKVLTGLNVVGGTIVATDSILAAFGKVQNQINGLLGGAIYQGVWNANTNSPALASGVGTKGYYYVVNVAGATNLDGITDWKVGDWAIFNGTTWDKVDNTDAVSSVNGFVGAVNLTTTNIPEGTQLYYTNARGIGSVLTSYVSGAGVISPTDTILEAIQKLNGNIAALPTYTFSTGLTNTLGTITNNLSTGIAGGQSIIGGTAASEGITISSTSNATKGVIKLGTTNVEVVNIGSASTVGQKLLRVGTSGAFVDLGHISTGPGASSAIWINQATPSSTNYTISAGGTAGNTTWNINSPSSVGVMAMSVDNVAHFTYNPVNARWIWNPAAVTGGATTNYRFITPANLAQTASTETIGFSLDMSASIEHATGAIATQRDFLIRNRTHTFVGASIITESDTVNIEGAVKGGINSTITNSNALTIASSTLTNVVNSYGLTVNAQTGATNNYVARFLGGNVGFRTSVPSAYVHIAAGGVASGSSPLKLTTQVAGLTTAEQGVFELINNTLSFTNSTTRRSIAMSQAVITATTQVANSTVETNVFTTSVNANELQVGKRIEVLLSGLYSSVSGAGANTLTVRVKYGGTTFLTFTTVENANTDQLFKIITIMTCRTTGVTGTLQAFGDIEINGTLIKANATTLATINTTTANNIDVTVQWNNANATNNIRVQQGRALYVDNNL